MPDPIQTPNKPAPADDPYFKKLAEQDANERASLGQRIAEKAYNPYLEAAPMSFNPRSTTDQNKNFERYYSHPSYNKLGFNPWADNETNYNDNSSGLGDLWRATKTAGKLAVTGFISPLRSYGDLLGGSPLSPDYESAEEMKYYNTVGSSTRGGVSGFTSNLITNSGYTIGLIGESILENYALAAVTLETGGLAAPLWMARLGKWGKDLGKYAEEIKNINKAREALNDYGAAKMFWEGTKKTASFLNPLENTVEALQIARNSKNLTGMAKVSTTAGAFFRDVQAANFTLAEAKMEGASAQQDAEEEMMNAYRENNGGKEPSDAEIAQIKKAALDAGTATLNWNIPAIFLTNKISFGPLLKSFNTPAEYMLRDGAKFIEKEGEGFVKATFKNKLVNSLRPKNLAALPITYFKENFAEGIQETTQEIISGTAKDYYKNLFYSKQKNSLDYGIGENRGNSVWDALSTNVADQFSGKGFETFASGFLMGGLMKVGGKVFIDPMIAAKNGVSDYKKEKSDYADKTLATLNAIYKDPLKYFAPDVLNYANAGESVSGQNVADVDGNAKEWYNNESQNLVSSVLTALDSGTYDIFLKRLAGVKSMEPQAIKDAYGVDGNEALSKIDKIVARAEQVKESYEQWNERFPNPFNPKAYKKGTDEYNQQALGYMAWENTKKLAIFNQSTFDANTRRIKSITEDILQTKSLSKVVGTDVSILFSPKDIDNEISMLNSEIEVLEGGEVPGNKETLAIKRSKARRLTKFKKTLEDYYVGQKLASLTEEEQKNPKYKTLLEEHKKTTVSQLRNAYGDYLKHLSTVDANTIFVSDMDVNTSFQKLLDIHDLSTENVYYAQAINLMSNPEGFITQHKRMKETFGELYENRAEVLKAGIDYVQSRIEDNTVLTLLHDRGFVLSPKDAEKLLEKKEYPTEFYDINAKQVVTQNDPIKYGEFVEIVKNYVAVTKQEPVEEIQEKPPVVETTPTQEENKTEEPAVLKTAPSITFDLDKRLQAVTTGEELDNLENDLLEIIPQTSAVDRIKLGLTSKIVNDKIAAKRVVLSEAVTMDSLQPGNLVDMVDSEYGIMKVIRKTDHDVVLQKVGDKSLKVIVKASNLRNTIKLKYSEKMIDGNKEAATQDELTKVAENAKKQDKFLENKDRQEELRKDALTRVNEIEKEFEELLGCK